MSTTYLRASSKKPTTTNIDITKEEAMREWRHLNNLKVSAWLRGEKEPKENERRRNELYAFLNPKPIQ